MRPRSVRASLLSVFASAAFVFVASSQGCDPNQGEGERCDQDSDCADGLVCITHTVCCPQDLNARKNSSSSDCRGTTGASADSGADGIADSGTVVDTNDAGQDAIGTACHHTSDCNDPALICLPGGTCGYECAGDRDCPSGSHCDCLAVFSGKCELGTTGGSLHCGVDAGTDASDASDAELDTATDDTGTAIDTTVADTTDAAAE